MKRFDTLVTLDFETYYSKSFSLSRMTTEEYVRDPQFRAHMVGLKVNAEKSYVVPRGDIQHALNQFNWKRTAMLGHHTHFDGLILSHHYGVKPAFFFDTLSMARALHGHSVTVKKSLGALAEYYGVGTKGRELANSLGIPDLPPALYQSIANYCANDVELTYSLFQKMRLGFPKAEYDVIDAVTKMFTRPTLELDTDILREYIKSEQERKGDLLETLRTWLNLESKDEVRDLIMSNQKFAELLEMHGVDVPTKISAATGKPTYALAKTDKGMLALLEHDDELIQSAAAARIGVKSTINETRALRMLNMQSRGKACVYLNYSGAWQTHRLSGGDSMNWQNFPSRDGKAMLRHSIKSPRGTKLLSVDSSNIELRVNMCAAGQRDAVEALRRGEDLYCQFAGKFYGREITKADKSERNFGKASILGLGYGMGEDKFVTSARSMYGVIVSPAESSKTVKLYRTTYQHIPRWWWAWNEVIPTLAAGRTAAMHEMGIRVERGRIILPTGHALHYPDLREIGGEWSISTRNGRSRVYGAKLVENITQALARNIVMEQTVAIARRFPVVLSVHDEVVFLCRDGEEAEAKAFALSVMSKSPDWWPEIPLAAEASAAYNYGDCK